MYLSTVLPSVALLASSAMSMPVRRTDSTAATPDNSANLLVLSTYTSYSSGITLLKQIF